MSNKKHIDARCEAHTAMETLSHIINLAESLRGCGASKDRIIEQCRRESDRQLTKFDKAGEALGIPVPRSAYHG